MNMQPDEVRAIRKKLRLTQAELAEELGMSLSAVNKMEKGAIPIEPRTAVALGHVFAMKINPEIDNEVAMQASKQLFKISALDPDDEFWFYCARSAASAAKLADLFWKNGFRHVSVSGPEQT